MPDAPAEPYLIQHGFEDFDEFAQTVRAWSLDFRQLDAGAFRGDTLQLGMGGIALIHARLDRVLDQRGAPPRDMRTLVVPANARQGFTWRGREVTGSDVLIFPSGAELEAASQPGFEVFTISLSEELLAEAAATLELPDPASLLGQNEVVSCRADTMASLQRQLHRITSAAADSPGLLAQPGLQEELTRAMPGSLLSALASATGEPPPLPQPRQSLLRTADAFIAEFGDEALTVRELCRAVGASERTLRRAFLERFGVAPKTYMTALRLNGVRRELHRANPSTTKVSDIANNWGFWHMGQFAADYRRQFSELPSATLHR